MDRPPIKNELRRLARIVPLLLFGGLLLGLGLAARQVFVDGEWMHGLWRTAAFGGAQMLNRTLFSAFSVAVFVYVAAAAQVLAGRSRAAALRFVAGFLLFYPLFLTLAWLFTDRAATALNLRAAKLPEYLRQSQDYSQYMTDNYIAWLDLGRLRFLLFDKASWFWPSAALAAMFGLWFDRGVAALAVRLRRRRSTQPAPAPRTPGRLAPAAALCAVVVAALLANMAARVAATTNREARPNVIVISLDTVRADRLGCYGKAGAGTAALDRLASTGVVFESAISNSSWTLPGHGAMLTGVQPTSLGLFKVTDRLNPGALTMAKVFRENGFDTGAVVSYVLLDKAYGFDQGFQVFDYRDVQPAKTVVDKAIAFIEPRQARKFFLFLHMYDAHWPYEPKEATAQEFWPSYIGPELRQLINTGDWAQFALQVINGSPLLNDYCEAMYQGKIHDVDDEIGRLLAYLVNKKLIDRTVIVVTADHGEQFLEHGLLGHGLTLYDEELHVPLIMRFPPLLAAGGRVKGQVQTLDIFPTIMDLAGLDPKKYAFAGKDLLLMAAAGAATARAMIAETSMSGEPRYAMRNDRFKIVTPFALDFGNDLRIQHPEEVFDLQADPREIENLAPGRPKMAEALRLEMAEQMKAIRLPRGAGESLARSQALSPVEIERLRSLGYIK